MFTTLGILYVVLGLFVIIFLVSQCKLMTISNDTQYGLLAQYDGKQYYRFAEYSDVVALAKQYQPDKVLISGSQEIGWQVIIIV